ncbi:hypothetical protein AB6D11_00920 [Vibrio splendidus]
MLYLMQQYQGHVHPISCDDPDTNGDWQYRGQSYQRATLKADNDQAAIRTFKATLGRVRKPTRLIRTDGHHDPIVLFALHCVDVDSSNRFIPKRAVSFAQEDHESQPPVVERHAYQVVESMMHSVVHLAETLGAVFNNEIVVRFNRHGESGGAYLKTDVRTGIMSNADVGISHRNNKLIVSIDRAFIKTECLNEHEGDWHLSTLHIKAKDTQHAQSTLRRLVREQTAQSLAEQPVLTLKEVNSRLSRDAI